MIKLKKQRDEYQPTNKIFDMNAIRVAYNPNVISVKILYADQIIIRIKHVIFSCRVCLGKI